MDFRQLLREERRRARESTQSIAKSETPITSKSSKKEEEKSLEWLSPTIKIWAERTKIDINEFRRGPIPDVYYIPNWITEDEEKAVLERVYAVPDDNELWVRLKHRRLQMWGGEVKDPFEPKPLPQWLMQISQTLVDVGIFSEEKKPNHVLINEYGVGDCILPHEDGPAYFPFVAIISTGAECRVTFELHRALISTESTSLAPSDIVPHFDFQLERRSLLLFTGEAYTRYLHSIDNIQGVEWCKSMTNASNVAVKAAKSFSTSEEVSKFAIVSRKRRLDASRLSLHYSNYLKECKTIVKLLMVQELQWNHRERSTRGTTSNQSTRSPNFAGKARKGKSGVGGTLQPINPLAHASVTTLSNNEASLCMDDFNLDTPSFVTLASAMKMRACEVFWHRVHMQLICSRESSPEHLGLYSAVLCVRRRRRHGCFGSSSIAISLDRRMHPVKVLPTTPKNTRKLMIGIEYGWRARHIWFRAPNVEVYDQWNDVIRSALQGYVGQNEEQSLAKWVDRSGISTMNTAITNAVCGLNRFSTDSYTRGCSTSYRSDIPEEE